MYKAKSKDLRLLIILYTLCIKLFYFTFPLKSPLVGVCNEDVNPSREAHSEKLPLNTQLERNPGPLTGAELRWRGVEMTAPLSR